jgi:aromatic ring-cleaving dioxygenase
MLVPQVVPWFTQMYTSVNTGSLLVHTNTGCEYEDHSIWALWGGTAWPLDMDIFVPWTQVGLKLGLTR